MASPFNFKVLMLGDSDVSQAQELSFSTENNPVSIADVDKLPSFRESHYLKLIFKVGETASHQWKLFILGTNSFAYQIQNLEPNPDYKKDPQDRTNGQSCKFYFPVGEHVMVDPQAQYKSYVQENNPITPNVYTVKVTDGTHWYYSHFMIAPKELTLKEWSDMLNEIGSLSYRLNIDKSSVQQGFVNQKGYDVSVMFADRMTTLAPRLRVALHFILQSFRCDTKKHYRWVRQGREHDIDARTVQMSARFPASIGMIYAPYRYSDYDTGDNRWIKFIATRILKWANQCLETYNSSELADRHQLLRLRNYLSYALNTTVLNQVSDYPPRYMTKGLIYSPRYNQFFRLYQMLLKSRQTKLTIKPNQYRFKNTDKLYEFWVFIKVTQALRYYGYRPVKGWGCGTSNDTWLLNPNTRVLMYNPSNHVYLRAVYDDDIGGYASRYEEPILMFGTKHQRPDVRIDIFYDNRDYWGSLILDAKYKGFRNVMNNVAMNGQLSDYALKAFDRYNNSRWVDYGLHTTLRVLAVYTGPNESHFKNSYHAYLSRLNQFNVNLEMLRPDNPEALYSFANDIHVLLSHRIAIMKKKLAKKRSMATSSETASNQN